MAEGSHRRAWQFAQLSLQPVDIDPASAEPEGAEIAGALPSLDVP